MNGRNKARELRDLARAMARQARMLRDDGFIARAREVARRAIALDRLGWMLLRPQPAPVAVRTVGRANGHANRRRSPS